MMIPKRFARKKSTGLDSKNRVLYIFFTPDERIQNLIARTRKDFALYSCNIDENLRILVVELRMEMIIQPTLKSWR